MPVDTLHIWGRDIPVSPVEEAFPGSELCVSSEAPEASPQMYRWSSSPVNSTVVVLLVILSIVFLRNILSSIVPIAGCYTRPRGVYNLESNLRSVKDRNIFAILMVLPFTMMLSGYRIWNPRFASGLTDELHLAVTTGAFIAAAFFRYLLTTQLRGRRTNIESFNNANRFTYTHFIVLVIVMLATAGILSISGAGFVVSRRILLWVMAVMGVILIIRKINIFNYFCSPFASFLYLCGLEILPAGLFAAAAVLL